MIVHFKTYANELNRAIWNLDTSVLDDAARAIIDCVKKGGTIYSCGNGGSAAIADHLACDCLKGIRTDTDLKPRVVSLASNGPLMTAIANDFSYEDVFSYQLESLLQPNDILITISSSGNSPNIKKAIDTAKKRGNMTVALCGFAGGYSKNADIVLHVKSDNYGIVEDVHQSIMHMLAQYIRLLYARDDADLKL